MSTWDNNPYYGENNDGLQVVASIELYEEDYQFDIAAVFYKDHKFYTGMDSGCSCPTPFEDFNSLEDFDGPFTKEHILNEWIPSLKGYAPNLTEKKMNLRNWVSKWNPEENTSTKGSNEDYF